MIPSACLRYEAAVIRAQSEDVRALSNSRREALARCADRLEALARGEYPYVNVSYGEFKVRAATAREGSAPKDESA